MYCGIIHSANTVFNCTNLNRSNLVAAGTRKRAGKSIAVLGLLYWHLLKESVVYMEEFDRDHMSEVLFDRRLFTGGLIAAIIAGSFNPLLSIKAFAEPTSAEKQAEADEVKRKLEAWGKELDQASTKYYLALEAYENAVAAMNEAQARMDAADAEVTRIQEKLSTRATSMYKQGQYSYLDVVFGARSFSEFTSSWDMLSSVASSDAMLIEQSKTYKREAQLARDEFAAQERLALAKLEEAEEIRANAEQIVVLFMAELASLEEEVAALLEKERLEEEERQKKAAEEERLRRAAEEARKQAEIEANNKSGNGWGDGVPVFSGGVTDIICQAAISRLGCPYVWAATGPNSFDCSGLTQWCYKQAGISIPRVDTSQRAAATSVLPVSAAEPGDILWMPGHVGIYMGDNCYIHAPTPGDVVRYAYNMGMWYNTCRY